MSIYDGTAARLLGLVLRLEVIHPVLREVNVSGHRQRTVVADWTLYTPLWYLQEAECQRQDALILEMTDPGTQVIHENKGRRPIVLADTYPRYYSIAELIEGCYLEPVRPICRLAPREEGQ